VQWSWDVNGDRISGPCRDLWQLLSRSPVLRSHAVLGVPRQAMPAFEGWTRGVFCRRQRRYGERRLLAGTLHYLVVTRWCCNPPSAEVFEGLAKSYHSRAQENAETCQAKLWRKSTTTLTAQGPSSALASILARWVSTDRAKPSLVVGGK
jgi:hypothetical protein